MNVTSEGTMGGWEEQAVLQASDRRSGDRFGAAVALDQVTYVSLASVRIVDALSGKAGAQTWLVGMDEKRVPEQCD